MASPRIVRSGQPLSEAETGCLETFDKELPFLFATLQRLGAHSNDIEDLLQEIFAILYRNWPTLDRSHTLRPWLFAVAFRVVKSLRRRRARETPHAEMDPEDSTRDPEGTLLGQESMALLARALERVPAKRRAVLVMHHLEGLEVIDIARRLSITKFAIYARLYKGRKELASALRAVSRLEESR